MTLALFDLSFWGYALVTLVLTHITIASVTIYLHRHQSHNTLTLHPIASHFFRFWLWLTTGMVTKEWVAIHRKHHGQCETAGDPHSPKYKGILTVLFGGAWLYRLAAENPETMEKYGSGTPDDWLERNIYARHPIWGIAIMGLIDVLLFGMPGMAIFAIQMIWIPLWAAGVINGIGHYWGYRNFETQDASTNIVPWGILIGGEELHNNHHAYAASAKLSNKWWEFDIGWFYIRLLEIMGLASVKRVSPKVKNVHGKQVIDLETARAVVRNRFHIMKLYGCNVIQPVLKDAQRKTDLVGQRLIQHARKLMTREDVSIEAKEQEVINHALQLSSKLETVYQFKQQLKEIWSRTSQNQVTRVQRLQAWCVEAEATGIRVLQDFAIYLRGYSLQERVC